MKNWRERKVTSNVRTDRWRARGGASWQAGGPLPDAAWHLCHQAGLQLPGPLWSVGAGVPVSLGTSPCQEPREAQRIRSETPRPQEVPGLPRCGRTFLAPAPLGRLSGVGNLVVGS